MNAPATSIFAETQWFYRRWWWLLGAASALVLGAAGTALWQESSWPAVLMLVMVGLPTVAGLWLMRLTVRIDAEGVHYRYLPLLWRWRHWPWSEFWQVFPRTYSPLGDYGGWGIRGLPGNLAYNVWGGAGLQLVFRSGNRLLLGTQRPDELRAVLTALLAAHPTLPITMPAAPATTLR